MSDLRSSFFFPLIARLQEIGRFPMNIAPLHFAYALIGAIDVFFHRAEKYRRLTGADPAAPDVADSHSRAVEFMFLGNRQLRTPTHDWSFLGKLDPRPNRG